MLKNLLVAAVLLILYAPAVAAPPARAHESIPVAALQSDFAALYSGLESAHYDLFAHRSRAEYDALYEEMLAGLDRPMTPFEAQVRFQEFVAYGNVAHARIEFPHGAYKKFRDEGGRAFPIMLRIDNARAYVGGNFSGIDRIERGDEILALDGRPIREWLARTARHISADTPYIAHSILEFDFPQYLWLEEGERARFRLKTRRGPQIRVLTVPARTREEQQAAAAAAEAAFAIDSNERVARMLEDGVAYLRPGPFYNAENPEALWDNSAFIAFIDASFEQFLAAKAEALIVDLRENPGGDNSFSDPMIAWFADRPFKFAKAFRVKSSPEARASNQARLDAAPELAAGASGIFAKKYAETPYGNVFEFDIPEASPRDGERFRGRVFVLVNRHTYSNAVNVAAAVQDYGFGKVLGEKTSDMATTYGAMETFRLPETGIEVGFPKAHIIRPSGAEESDGVAPDVAIVSPVKPETNDSVLEKAVRIVGSSRSE